ncbi:MAG: DEAD/DEAH box helicase family protein [Actinobacteria bacterium]|nr:DEAD/DEAH box helicase family protein [Actinomycetota bacterium]
MPPFKITSEFRPAGDQPQAIAELVGGVRRAERDQVLLGVTGSGKTFTMAKVIEETQRPALILAPNKTLAAQLYGEFKSFFPDNAVEYFVSYYDYYQPEAYVPSRDLYIEKDSAINEEVDRLRHAATAALFARRDVIIVASVSAIFGLGSPETYEMNMQVLRKGDIVDRDALLRKLVSIQYTRNDTVLGRGTFRVRGETLEVFPAYEESAFRATLFGDEVERLQHFDPLTGELIADAARTVGGGGGKGPELAVAGGRDPSKLDEALDRARAAAAALVVRGRHAELLVQAARSLRRGRREQVPDDPAGLGHDRQHLPQPLDVPSLAEHPWCLALGVAVRGPRQLHHRGQRLVEVRDGLVVGDQTPRELQLTPAAVTS